MRHDFPTNPQLEEATVKALEQLGGRGTVPEIKEKIIEILELTPEVIELEDESGIGTKLDYCLRWTRTKLKGSKIKNVSRGVWELL